MITGATGLVGRSLVQRLQGRFPLRITARSPEKARFVKTAGVEVLLGDLQDKDFVCEAVRGTDYVVHLAATFGASDALKVNTIFMRNIISACRNNGPGRLIFMSSINSKFKRQGPYSLAKRICEEELSKSDLDYCILRPTLIYDDSGGVFLLQLLKFMKQFRIAPIIGTGEYRIQPIHLDDVISITEKVLFSHKEKAYDLVGPDIISYNLLAEMIFESMGRKGGIKIHIPLNLLKVIGPFFNVTRDKILELGEEKTGDPQILIREFGAPIIKLENKLGRMLGNLN